MHPGTTSRRPHNPPAEVMQLCSCTPIMDHIVGGTVTKAGKNLSPPFPSILRGTSPTPVSLFLFLADWERGGLYSFSCPAPPGLDQRQGWWKWAGSPCLLLGWQGTPRGNRQKGETHPLPLLLALFLGGMGQEWLWSLPSLLPAHQLGIVDIASTAGGEGE